MSEEKEINQPETSISQAMQGKIFSMLEEVISDDNSCENEGEFEECENQIFSNCFSDDNNDKDSNSSPSTNHTTLTLRNPKISYFSDRAKNKFSQALSSADSSFSTMDFNPKSHSDFKKSKTCEYHNPWSFANCFLPPVLDNLNEYDPKNLNRSLSLHQPEINFNTKNLFQLNIPSPQCFKKNISSSPVNQNENFVMPLRTFNFKHSYSKNQRHMPQSTQNYNETYNGYTMSTNQNNIVVPLFKNKFSPNKNISSFEQKCLKLETYLLSNKCFTMEIYEEFKEEFINFLKNQQTSRLCQFFFDGTNDEVVHIIFKDISEELLNLLTDPYANYFILKIFTHLNKADRLTFLTVVSNSLDWLAINKISTYPIQIILEKLNSRKEQEIIINSIKKHVIKLSLDVYGTHVIERIVTNFPYDLIEPISYTIAQNFLFLANNPNGLCIIKKIIVVENKRNNHSIIQKSIEENALALVQNPYGNYALQAALTYWNYEDCKGFINCFKENFLLLSTQKYSSNVIEKCFELDQNFLIDFINANIYSENTLTVLLKNIFGNYVLQTVLKYIEDDNNKKKIKKQIESCLEKVHDNKIIYKWKKILNHYFPILN